jgi:rare lipoprotein A
MLPPSSPGQKSTDWMLWALLPALICTLTLSGCEFSDSGLLPSTTTSQQQDGPPLLQRDFDLIAEPEPKTEPRSRYGNHSPYQVFGQTYSVLTDGTGYQEAGIASWYGQKFSERPTSSMEPYDPYAMTAAHRSLPLPSYVSVTNLENGRQVVVRVNDRGPFHSDRIIDLSYAAAGKLGFINQGTAKVLVKVITTPPALEKPDKPPALTNHIDTAAAIVTEAIATEAIFLQAGAFRSEQSARQLQRKLAATTQVPVNVIAANDQTLFRVKFGPFADEASARQTQSILKSSHQVETIVVRQSVASDY